MSRHHAVWTAPPPFWGKLGPQNPGFHRPRLLRFASDSFMDDVFKLLERDPRDLPALEAEPETWRGPSRRAANLPGPVPKAPESIASFRRLLRDRANPTALSPLRMPSAEAPLKLYQAAHQRHYMVAVHLLCQRAGLPERSIDRAKQQSVSHLVRRLVYNAAPDSPPDRGPVWNPSTRNFPGWSEFGWVAGSDPHWEAIVAADRVNQDEERLPLFPANYRDEHQRKRRLLLGTVPVGRREAYQGTPLVRPTTQDVDPRAIFFRTQVTAPWLALAESAFDAQGGVSDELKKQGPGNSDDVALDPSNGDDRPLYDSALQNLRGRLQTG